MPMRTLLLVLLLLAGCQGAPAQPAGEHGEFDPASAGALEQCLAESGYPPKAVGTPPVGDTPSDSVWADSEFNRVFARCLVSSGAGEADGDDPREIATQNERATLLTNCMRERGWDVPDPTQVPGPAGSEYLVPRVGEPPRQDAETTQAYFGDLVECGDEVGLPVVGD